MALTIQPSLAIIINTAVKNALDSGGAAGSAKFYSAAGVLLAVCPFTYPCGTVNGTTGQLTITLGPRDEQADASGDAYYVTFCSSDNAERFRLSVVESLVPVDNAVTMPSKTIVANTPVEVTSIVIG